MTKTRSRASLVALVTVLALASLLFAGRSTAATDPPPTDAGISASRGPYATAQTTASFVSGFGGGTIYYPTASGTFGGVAISPGFTATQSSISWMGPRLASFGFVVITIDTLTIFDQPAQRGDELLAALRYLTGSSSVRSKVDASRLAVAGHSMGGGGTLEAANKNPALKAAIPLAPWNLNTNWSRLRVPTLIIGGQADLIAPVAVHSIPFYNSIPSSTPKAYLELVGQSHFFPNSPNTTQAKAMVAWLKLYVDGDTRYRQFLVPRVNALDISSYRISGV